MRKGISLIELIFTIVIIAVVFTVIPKIVLALNKSDEFSIKQDALFNGVTMMQMISRLSWDENSTKSNDILMFTNPSSDQNLTCNDDNTSASYRYRKGGFKGSRSYGEYNTSIAGITSEEGIGIANQALYNDIDDFNGSDRNTTLNSSSKYGLHVEVKYVSDIITYNTASQNAKINLTQLPTNPTNLKMVDINVTYQGKRAQASTAITQFSFVSANIGKVFLAKRTW